MLTVRSRVLLSIREDEEEFGPAAPFSYKDILGSWFGCLANQQPSAESPADGVLEPIMPMVNIMDKETEINQTGEGARSAARDTSTVEAPSGNQQQHQQQASMHPDITVTTTAKRMNATA